MMNIPNLPTDNLYKFKFISGVLILAFAAYIYVTEVNYSFSNIIKSSISSKKLDLQISLRENKLNEIKIEELKLKINTINLSLSERFYLENYLSGQKAYIDSVYSTINIDNNILAIKRNNQNIERLENEAKVINNEIANNLIELKLCITRSSYDTIVLIITSIITFILIFYGRRITKSGYNEWHELVQKPIDEKLFLELKIMKSENNVSK